MAEVEKRALGVEDVRRGALDFAGDRIVCIYAYTPPEYAVYRTATRVMVHFSGTTNVAAQQRASIACFTPLRGQINSLIDGWHSAGGPAFDPQESGDREKQRRATGVEHPLRKRAARYDRRVADALVVGLDGMTELAVSLLAEIKNDIISERIAIARMSYLGVALCLGIFITFVMYGLWLVSAAPLNAVWTGVAGGTLGALFSIALGLKGRTVLIDLQKFQNLFDAVLRMLIGAISGGMLLCLFLSGVVSNVIKVDQLSSSAAPDGLPSTALLVFAVGFLGGFFERLVPDLLSKTNLGTEEEKGGGKGTAAVQGGSVSAESGTAHYASQGRQGGSTGSESKSSQADALAETPGTAGQSADGENGQVDEAEDSADGASDRISPDATDAASGNADEPGSAGARNDH